MEIALINDKAIILLILKIIYENSDNIDNSH